MGLGPNEITFKEVLINSLGSLIAGAIGSIIIIILLFISANLINIPTSLNISGNVSIIFPIVISIITFIGTSVCIFLSYYLLSLTNGEKYRRNRIILGQISFFGIFLYICMIPVYLYVGIVDFSEIVNVFFAHTIILVFGLNILLEVLNGYRYVLLGIYGSFVGLFISLLFMIIILLSFSSEGYGRLLLLLGLLPIINFIITFFKQVFELFYYHYSRYTNMDQLGDIFYQIEIEEKEKAKQL